MPNKNIETEKDEERRCGRLCPDCPMKNNDDKCGDLLEKHHNRPKIFLTGVDNRQNLF